METTDLTTSNDDSQLQRPSGGIANDLDEIARIANMMAQSGFFDDAKTAAQAGVKILAGRELGIPEMAAMRGVHVMKGNTTLSGPLLAALIKRHPRYDYDVVEATDERAEIAFYDSGDKAGTASFSWQEAENIGLTSKQNWRHYPSDMLFWRALTRGQRRYAPDVGMGAVYTADELGAETNAEGEPVEVEAETVPQNGQSEPQPAGDATDAQPETTIEEKLQKAATYLDRASSSGDPQKLRSAIDTVTDRADEKLSGDDATRMHMVTTPYELVGRLRGTVQDGEVDESAFNAVLDEALTALAQLPDEAGVPGEEWGRSVVAEEAQRIEDAVDGFTIDTAGDAESEPTDDEKAVEAMQNGETALDKATAPDPFDELPERFPGRSYLVDAGIDTMEEVVDMAALGELTSVDGIGEETAEKIRTHLAETADGDLFA
jgi:hypothetical protein